MAASLEQCTQILTSGVIPRLQMGGGGGVLSRKVPPFSALGGAFLGSNLSGSARPADGNSCRLAANSVAHHVGKRTSARRCRHLVIAADTSPTAGGGRSSQSSVVGTEKTVSETRRKRVVVVGGTGRVGRSVASSLANPIINGHGGSTNDVDDNWPSIDIVIAGRNRETGEQVASTIRGGAEFLECNINDEESLARAMDGADLVIHTAGPFQRAKRCTVLEAAIKTKTPYIDVCDDTEYAKRAKALHGRAKEAGVPAITTTGIYPGISNLMAAELVRLAKGNGASSEDGEINSRQPDKLRFSYFTAGTGGAGPTILATSFLLLGEDVVAYKDGEPVIMRAWSGRNEVDFGAGVGRKDVYLLNLPEVASARSVLQVPSVSARFGTAPFFWNIAMEAVAALVPRETLQDPEKVQGIVNISYPFVKGFDKSVGEQMSMRVDLECTDGVKSVAIYTHKYLSRAVGVATSAFARAVLEGHTQPGVWFPEQEEGIPVEHREVLLRRGSQGTSNFQINRAPWAIETPPKEIGFGMYY